MLVDLVEESLMLQYNHHRHIKRERDDDEGTDNGIQAAADGNDDLDGEIVGNDGDVESVVDNDDEQNAEEEEEEGLRGGEEII